MGGADLFHDFGGETVGEVAGSTCAAMDPMVLVQAVVLLGSGRRARTMEYRELAENLGEDCLQSSDNVLHHVDWDST